MLNRLIPLVQKLKKRNPNLYKTLVRIGKRFAGKRLGIYPRILGDEIKAASRVLKSSQWNMVYGKSLAHDRLEESFAEYLQVPFAVAVGSGGIGLQMSIRALGLEAGDEVIHQVDTCSATAMAVMNAGVTPVFADISDKTFMLDPQSITNYFTGSTRAILATHMWGNPEDMKTLREKASSSGIKLIEDACLSLGTIAQGRKAGAWGDVGVFSFGCIKPIQGGEGGMIITSDSELARELKAMRHWGDRTLEFGVRDVTQLSWNGRMSEIVAAVVHEQLRGYPKHLSQLRDAVADFSNFLERFQGISLTLGNANHINECTFTQVVLRINENSSLSKQSLWTGLIDRGIPVWHANFELINTLSLFKNDVWRKWILRGDLERVNNNIKSNFAVANQVFTKSGMGLSKMNFLSPGNLKHLKKSIESIYLKKGK